VGDYGKPLWGVFYTISWWLNAVQGKKRQYQRMIAVTFVGAAIAAPFLALGGVEFIHYQHPWTKQLPYLGILGSFLVGASAPVLVTKLTNALIQKVDTKTISNEDEKQ
jgi:hypothetical protein